MRYYWLRWVVGLLLLGVLAFVLINLDGSSIHRDVKLRGNIEFTYGEGWNGKTPANINEVLIYSGKHWVLASSDGKLVRVDGGFKLQLNPGEKVVEAEVDYSNSNSSSLGSRFRAIPWHGQGVAQFKRKFRDPKGRLHNLHISGIGILVYKPHSPIPPLKGEMAVCTALSHKEDCGWLE